MTFLFRTMRGIGILAFKKCGKRHDLIKSVIEDLCLVYAGRCVAVKDFCKEVNERLPPSYAINSHALPRFVKDFVDSRKISQGISYYILKERDLILEIYSVDGDSCEAY